MNFNPFKICYGYHAARWHGKKRRHEFVKQLAALDSLGVNGSTERLPCEVVSMLGEGSVPDAIFAFRSLYLHAGLPQKITLVSDGTLKPRSVELLEHTLAPARVCSISDIISSSLPNVIGGRLMDSWMVAKQAILMSLPRKMPALFLDTDIVFFAAARKLAADLKSLGDRPAFMCDTHASFDERLLRDDDVRTPPLNSGFLYLPRPIDWTTAVGRFALLPEDTELAFIDQTLSHLAFHQAGAVPLDTSRYVLQIDDQFRYRDNYANKPGVVCRHYVNTIRHKMWKQVPFK